MTILEKEIFEKNSQNTSKTTSNIDQGLPINLDNQLWGYILTPPSINGERARWMLSYWSLSDPFVTNPSD